jgi:hypothetical protein
MEAQKDISGFRIFHRGDVGRAHAIAHRALDEGRLREGYVALGRFLDGCRGAGSQWVHIQWHMLVFELAVDEWDAAFARFSAHIQPAAEQADMAATDAPAALWRLALASPHDVDLPWDEVHESALSRMGLARDHYVELHDLLALAGARDLSALDRWVRSHRVRCERDRILDDLGRALRFYAAGLYAEAAQRLAIALPSIGRLGGSRAQNELFVDLQRQAARAARQHRQPWEATRTESRAA